METEDQIMSEKIMLEQKNVSIILGEKPGVISAKSRDFDSVLYGNPAQFCAVWGVYDPRSGSLAEVKDTDGVSYTCEKDGDTVLWKAQLPMGVSAVVRAEVKDNAVRFTLTDVKETDEAHLVTLRLNGLAAAVETDPASRLAMPSHGGRLINPAVCADGQTDHRYNWILDSFGSASVVYTRSLTAVVRIHLMDDQLTTQVGGEEGSRYAQVGALLRRCYTKLDDSYRKAKPQRDPACVEDADDLPIEEDFLLEQEPCVTVEYISHEAVKPESGWTVGAGLVRDSLPGKKSDYYKGKMVYKIFVGAPNQPVSTNLEQIRELVFDVAKRTGNAGQLPYLVGFQHEGHDSMYPDVFTLNPALESVEKLQQLVEDAEKVNCFISFHDNFDDAYAVSPSWDADDVSRDNTGHLLRGGVWNGVQAYWNSMPWYAKHKADARIERTMAMYPFLKDTYHLDVLTASVFRIDFRGGEPTGRQADLEGRIAIVEKFREHGLDLTSEACGLPFVGSISYFWHMQRVARELYQGDSRIPMVPFLVHGKADYAGTHTDSMRNIMDGLLYGGFYCNDVTAKTNVKELTDAYFMVQCPLELLRDDKAVAYEEKNSWKTVRYQSGAEIRVNFESEECSVTVNGVKLIENGSAMIPQQDGSTVIYRCAEEPYTDVLWHTGCVPGTKLTAEPMGVEAETRTLTVGEDGCVAIDTTLGVAYRVKKVEA